MNEKQRLIVDIVLASLLLFVPAFLLHSDGRFAGSLAGFVLGSCAAALLLLLLLYPVTKYSGAWKASVTWRMSMRTLLTLHVHGGILAAFFALLHTGHKFQSPLGIALVISLLIVVVIGFVGRYYLPQTVAELREQQSYLAVLRSSYERTAAYLSSRDAVASDNSGTHASVLQNVPLWQLVDGISDLESAIGSSDTMRKIFMPWIGVHVIAAIIMYALLALHVSAELYYGLRWLA
ncbi:iron reductase [Bradyrhizobium sp. HKCCYLS1011]|uniref:iron reductase n=1 Tax=Bradyrhizobium sp. HKCCYLS1011 TaxID=3420733 RepID=UPI003EB84E04